MPSFEDGISAAETIAEEYGIDFAKLRRFASDHLAETWPADQGISSSDTNHHLAQLGNHRPQLLRDQARMWKVIKDSAEESGRTEDEQLERFRQLFAPIED